MVFLVPFNSPPFPCASQHQPTRLEEALALELGDPGLSPVLRHVVLVVLVEHAATELPGLDLGLGLSVVVVVGAGEAHESAAGGLELVVELSGGIAVVVSVALLVSNAKDGDLLSAEIEAGESLVEPLVPGGARALRVGAGVPRGGTDDEGVVGRSIGIANVLEVTSIDAGSLQGLDNVSTAGLAVPCHGGVEDTGRRQAGGSAEGCGSDDSAKSTGRGQ